MRNKTPNLTFEKVIKTFCTIANKPCSPLSIVNPFATPIAALVKLNLQNSCKYVTIPRLKMKKALRVAAPNAFGLNLPTPTSERIS